MQEEAHKPVMLNEALNYLAPSDGQTFLDCTFGAGGYSQALLNSANCSVTALDRDSHTIQYSELLKQRFSDRFKFCLTDFASAKKYLQQNNNVTTFDGLVMDLGVSSMQLDQAERGFSFTLDGPLDMRMQNNHGLTAEMFINSAKEEEIADVIYRYGDEPYARKIARNIVNSRIQKPITTTHQLAEIVRNTIKFRPSKIDLATKTFQAIRIHVNDELQQLKDFLATIKDLLKPGGRIVIVAFHSLEDSIIKQFFKNNSAKKEAKSKYAVSNKQEISDKGSNAWLKIITRKPLVPSTTEINNNPRARSAKMRVAIKL